MRDNMHKIQKGFEILGPILLILGIIYWFGDIHVDEWEYNPLLTHFPNINKHLILPISYIWNKLDNTIIINTNGKFGIQLMFIAFVLININISSKNNMYYTMSKIIIFIIFIWHLFVQLLYNKPLSDELFDYFVILISCCIVGKVVGKIISQVIKRFHADDDVANDL